MIRRGKLFLFPFILCSPAFAQHSAGVNLNLGAMGSFNRAVDHYLVGFEKSAGLWYRYQPKNTVFGFQFSSSLNAKNYVFRFAQDNAIILKQNLFAFGIAATLKLKHGAQFITGFNTGFLAYSQTATRYDNGNTLYTYSDNQLNQLQRCNKFQVDVCLEVDQPIGPKQKFMVGLMINQNVNHVLSADFKYPYHDNNGRPTYLEVNNTLCPLTASVAFRYKIK